jgi:hypothetical protein
MEPGLWAVLISFITLVVVAFLLWKRNEPVTLEGIVSTVEEAAPIAQTLATVAEIGVQAAEQLYTTGRLNRDERLNYALNYVKSWSPALSRLDNEKIFGAIEAAVLAANALKAQAQELKKPQTGLPLQ